jgi:flagellar protein FlbT
LNGANGGGKLPPFPRFAGLAGIGKSRKRWHYLHFTGILSRFRRSSALTRLGIPLGRIPAMEFFSRAVMRKKETWMPLRVELKPFERIIIGQSVITNSDSRTAFLIDGDAPILREKDILTAETANTPVKRIYLCVQMMYLENDIPAYQELYLGFIKELIEAVPSFRDQIEAVSNLILSGNLYKALRELRPMIKREEDLLR